jgi:3-dehydroquinate synthase
MKIQSYCKSYDVSICSALKISEFTEGENYLVIADKAVYAAYKDTVFHGIADDRLILFDAVEENKTIESALGICKRMAEISFKRSDTIISVGGGIVQDVSGFSANIYNRGVKWIFVPTTLLAQCDSCIGGKTSLNFLSYKNILGTFYAPDQICIYMEFIKTLSAHDYLSGLGEVAKFNIMAAHDGLGLLEQCIDKLLSRDTEALLFFLERSLSFKKKFIEQDEFDKNVRNLLNFAHTFGHAFESVSHYAVPHGQAVSLGLIIANIISSNRGILDNQLRSRIEKLCVQLISVPLNREWFDQEKIVTSMKKDKKRRSDKLTAVLFKTDLTLEIVHDIEPNEVGSALDEIYQLLVSSDKI